MKRQVWSSRARDDLDAIWDYYASEADVDVAERVVRKLYERVADLDRHPELGREADEARPGWRVLTVSPHIVFYRLTTDAIEVLRVLHGRRDRESALGDGDS